MRFGILLPNVGEFASPRTLVDLAVAAEVAGWDGVFLWDMLSLSFDEEPWPAANQWIAMAAVAQRTERILFGPLVTPLARRRPAKVARETVTLDHLSQGRLILGVGLGGAEREFDDFGEDSDPKVRASKLDEISRCTCAALVGRSRSRTQGCTTTSETASSCRRRSGVRASPCGWEGIGRTRRPRDERRAGTGCS